jgi:hypothetical protein
LLALLSQVLAPVIQCALTDPQVAGNLAHRFATALEESHGFPFELLGLGLLVLAHPPLLRESLFHICSLHHIGGRSEGETFLQQSVDGGRIPLGGKRPPG